MTGEIATAGDIAGGLLTARAVEPAAGDAHHGDASTLCLNCGTRLIGEHCHACGQSAHVHRTVGAIGHELAHGVFHFEGKIWRTLPMLMFRPGELTRRYVAGERARFVSPLALFLFSVFLMFAVMGNLPGMSLGDMNGFAGEGGINRVGAQVADELLKTRAEIPRLQRRLARGRASAEPDTKDIAELERDLVKARENLAGLERAQRFLPAPDPAAAKEHPADDWLEAKYRHASENPKLLIYKIKNSAYKYSWALIPISLPFIWMLFPFRRGVGMYDHAVFATYSLSFMSLLVVILATLGAAGVSSNWLRLAAMLIPPVHIYKQLKGGYRLSRAGALWRTVWMVTFAFVTSTLFALFLLTMGVSD